MAVIYDYIAIAKYSLEEKNFKSPAITSKVATPRPIREWEYKIPTPDNYPLLNSFKIDKEGLYQIDFELSAKPKSTLEISVNYAKLSNVNFVYNPNKSKYSVALIMLKKGTHSISIDSAEEIPLKSISVTPVSNPDSIKFFNNYEANQYGYLRAFLGNRRDDGQEFEPLPEILKVDAPLDSPQVLEFHCHIDDYPLPAYDENNKN